MAEPVHVVLTFDSNYWAPAFAVVRSAAISSRDPSRLTFHLIHTGLSAAIIETLDRLAQEFPITIRHVDLSGDGPYASFFEGLPTRAHFTPVVYARLLIDQLLPAGIDRVIYLDSDVYVRAPLEDLAATDLEGRPVGAVLDLDRHRIMLGRDLRQNHDLFDFHYRYFNSGVMVIDRAAYGAADLRARTIELFANGTLPRVQHDQIILNLVFKDNWTPLDFRWNLISPSPAHEALEPFIIHYTGHRKPWTLRSQAAYARVYRHTMTNEVFYRFWRQRLRRMGARLARKLMGKRK